MHDIIKKQKNYGTYSQLVQVMARKLVGCMPAQMDSWPKASICSRTYKTMYHVTICLVFKYVD